MNQLVIVVEQQAEVVLTPRRGRVDPRSFDAAGDGMLADAAMFCAAEPAEAKRAEIAARWRLAKQRSIAVAVRLAKGVPASGERHGFFRIHSHAQEGRLHVTRRKQRIGIAAGTFRIDVDQTHLYRCERSVEFVKAALRVDPSLHAFVDPLVLVAPVDVLFGFIDVGAAGSETEHRAAHRFDCNIAGENEQVGPADRLTILLLDRPQQAPGLVKIAVVRPRIERSEALLPGIGAPPPVTGAIGAGCVPGHADKERTVVAIISRPPRLAVGHQGSEIGLERSVIERLERFGIAEIVAHRIGRTVRSKHVDRQCIWPPILVLTPQQRADRGISMAHRASSVGGHGKFLQFQLQV